MSMMIDRILIDYDVDYELFESKYLNLILRRMRQLLGNAVKQYGYVKSHSGKVHFTIWLRRQIPEGEAIIYAVLMGSDFKRECLNYFRLMLIGEAESWFFNDYKTKGRGCGDKAINPIGLKKFIKDKCPQLPELVVKYARAIPGY